MDAVRAELRGKRKPPRSVNAIVFDTGELERNRQRVKAVFKTARVDAIPIVVPSVCVRGVHRHDRDGHRGVLRRPDFHL